MIGCILISLHQNVFAQEHLNDFGRLILNTYVPEQVEGLPQQAKSILANKLSQITTNYGLGGTTLNPRFVLMCNLALLSKDIVAGPPQMVVQNIELTLFIADAVENKKFANVSFTLKGVGTNEAKAYIDAISKMNIKNPELKDFIEEGKSKIVNYYNTQCDFIIKDAISLSKRGEYDAAMLKLVMVPDVCEKCYVTCMDTLQSIYQKKIDKECLVIMRDAKTAWMANQNSEGAERVAEIINSISPFSTCEPDAGLLMQQIQNKLKEDEKRKWQFKIAKYNDALNLKKEAMRIDEEEKKRNAELNKERQNQEYTLQKDQQKQDYALQKDQQKQQYALAKADQEAGGLRGFVNSITKLKLTLWRNNANDYINQHVKPIDYSSLNSR